MRKRPAGESSPSTRERVLDVALALFNESGMERVTTRLIAEAAGINEGNLYYHFRTKEALVLGLFGRFEAAVVASLDAGPAAASDLEPYSTMLRDWFLLTWSYRFLFRDLLALQVAAPALQARLRVLTGQLREATRAVFGSMQAAGLIAIPGEALEGMLANLWIVSSYWISYLMLHEGVEAVTPAHLAWGMGQVRSLYAPYLTEAARACLARHPG